MLKKITLLSAVAVISGIVLAGEDTLKTYTGEPVEVSAPRSVVEKTDSVREDITPSGSVLDEAARLTPALFFTRHSLIGYAVAAGAAGKVNFMGLGGSPTTQVIFTYDGDPLFMGLMGHPVYDAFSVLGLGKIQVVEGASPIDFGAGAMGGAVNLSTKRLRRQGILPTISGQFGEYGLLNTGAGIQGKTGKFDWGADYHSQHTDGYRDDANDAFWSQRFGGHLGFSSRRDDVLFSGHYDWFCVYNPGTEDSPADSNWYRIRRWHAHFHWRHDFGALSTQVGAFHHAGRHTIYDGFRSDDLSWGVRALVKYEFNSGEMGAKLMAVQMGGDAENINFGRDFGRHWATEYHSALWARKSVGKFYAKLGAGIFGREGYHTHFAPEILLGYNITGGEKIFAKVANGFRFPSLRELAVFPWSNPDLEPENSWTGLVGVASDRGILSGKVEFWHTYAENLIINGYPGHPYENSGVFNRNGITAEISLKPTDSLKIQTGLAYQDLKEQKSISPGVHWTGEIAYGFKVGVPVHLSFFWEGAKDLYASDDESDKLPDYLVGNLHAEIAPVPGLEFVKLTLAVDNFTDAKYYTQKGYPMPPRTVWGGIKISPELWKNR